MGSIKDINIDGIMNIKNFDSSLLKLVIQKSHTKTLLFITLDISPKKTNMKLIE